MARVYPSAGSAFTYVAHELHPMGGYIVGWSMQESEIPSLQASRRIAAKRA
jgi:amino acid transporter